MNISLCSLFTFLHGLNLWFCPLAFSIAPLVSAAFAQLPAYLLGSGLDHFYTACHSPFINGLLIKRGIFRSWLIAVSRFVVMPILNTMFKYKANKMFNAV